MQNNGKGKTKKLAARANLFLVNRKKSVLHVQFVFFANGLSRCTMTSFTTTTRKAYFIENSCGYLSSRSYYLNPIHFLYNDGHFENYATAYSHIELGPSVLVSAKRQSAGQCSWRVLITQGNSIVYLW